MRLKPNLYEKDEDAMKKERTNKENELLKRSGHSQRIVISLWNRKEDITDPTVFKKILKEYLL